MRVCGFCERFGRMCVCAYCVCACVLCEFLCFRNLCTLKIEKRIEKQNAGFALHRYQAI